MISLYNTNIIIIALICFSTSVESMVQIRSGSLNGTSIRSAQIYRKGDDYTSLFEPINGVLVNHTADNIAGNIVVFNGLGRSKLWFMIVEMKNRGAIAAIHITGDKNPGQEFCTYTGQTAEDIEIQVASVTKLDFGSVYERITNGEVIEVTITSEGNEWSTTIVSVATTVVARVMFGAWTIGLIGFGSFKLFMFIKVQGPQFNVPQVCLALEIIANVWRILSNIVDPLGCFNVLPTVASLYVNTAAIPFATATFVLVTFYWHEIVTDSSITIHPFLSRLKIPFFVVMLVLLAANLFIVLAGYYLDFNVTTGTAITFLIISVGFLVFYIITAVKVNARMREASKLRKIKRLNRVNSKMIMNAASAFSVLITGFVFALSGGDPVPFLASISFVGATMLFDSFARIHLFDVPKKAGNSSKSAAPTERQDTPSTQAETNL